MGGPTVIEGGDTARVVIQLKTVLVTVYSCPLRRQVLHGSVTPFLGALQVGIFDVSSR